MKTLEGHFVKRIIERAAEVARCSLHLYRELALSACSLVLSVDPQQEIHAR